MGIDVIDVDDLLEILDAAGQFVFTFLLIIFLMVFVPVWFPVWFIIKLNDMLK